MSVRKYAGKRGTTWHVVLERGKDADGKRRQEVVRDDPDTGLPMRTKTRSLEVERELLVKMRRGDIVLPNTTPLSAYLERWLRETTDDRGASTHYTWASIVRTRIIPKLGDIPLGHLSAIHLHGFFREQRERYASSSVNHTRTVLAAALNQAVRWRLLDRSPLDGLRLHTVTDNERLAWTADQARTFLHTTQDDVWGPLWRLLIDSGMRIGEALALRWDDLNGREVRISKTVAILSAKGNRGVREKTKTTSGRRMVTLAPATIDALKRHRVRQVERRLGLGEYWIDRGLIFDRGDGELVHATVCRDHFDAAVKALGLSEKSTPHCLRHTCATLLVAAGESLHAVKERLGHKNITITANLYSHASRDADKRLSETLARVLEG